MASEKDVVFALQEIAKLQRAITYLERLIQSLRKELNDQKGKT